MLPDEAKITSLINVNEDFPLSVKNGVLSDIVPIVNELLSEILVQLFDENQAFEHQPDSDYCQYCS